VPACLPVYLQCHWAAAAGELTSLHHHVPMWSQQPTLSHLPGSSTGLDLYAVSKYSMFLDLAFSNLSEFSVNGNLLQTILVQPWS